MTTVLSLDAAGAAFILRTLGKFFGVGNGFDGQDVEPGRFTPSEITWLAQQNLARLNRQRLLHPLAQGEPMKALAQRIQLQATQVLVAPGLPKWYNLGEDWALPPPYIAVPSDVVTVDARAKGAPLTVYDILLAMRFLSERPLFRVCKTLNLFVDQPQTWRVEVDLDHGEEEDDDDGEEEEE